MNYNRVILAGNLTRDPELSYTPSNTAVCVFGMAINRKWKGKDGNSKEEVCFVDVTAYGRTAEVVNQFMVKGRPILCEGRLRFQAWENKEGAKRSKLDVVMEHMQFLPTGERRESQAHDKGDCDPVGDDAIPF
jgi:single-strand DNA-binding protein